MYLSFFCHRGEEKSRNDHRLPLIERSAEPRLFPLLESDFYFPLILIYIGLYGATLAGREGVATHTHSRFAVSYTRVHAFVCTCVRSCVQTEGSTRGYLSVTRWQAYAPDAAFRWGDARGAGRAEAGHVGHNFQIYVQMFLSRAGNRVRGAIPRGEDAYRKVSRRIEKCSRGFFARAMMERGVDHPRRESRPFASVKRREGW